MSKNNTTHKKIHFRRPTNHDHSRNTRRYHDQVIHLLSKQVIHAKNVLVFHVLRIYAVKNRKTKNVPTWGRSVPMWLRFSFFEIFFSKFVKREKLAHFWYGLLKKRVNEWLGQWWLLLIFIPYSLTLSLTLSSALSF